MDIVTRRAEERDRIAILDVESKSTPGLRYLGKVFDEFAADEAGEFSVASIGGEVVGCGKFTVVPDGSAWLEALRVPPEHQGLGIGKRFYDRFFELAAQKDINIMRMYTNIGNVTSKGLAERYGFALAGTYRGMWLDCQGLEKPPSPSFINVTDPAEATRMLMSFKDRTEGFVIMNRTFYALSPALCAAWAEEGKVYADPSTGSLIVLGARFMPEQALHIALYGGDTEACLNFAISRAIDLGVEKLQCMFPPSSIDVQKALTSRGFSQDSYDCIVMERKTGGDEVVPRS